MSDSSRASLFAATLLGLALLLLLPCPAHAKKQPVDVPAGIEHRDFDALLKKYVDERGLVAYGRWKASAADLARLDRYLAQFDRPPAPVPAREKQSALINAYNGLVIRWMITNYPLDSIWEAKRSLTARRHRVGGHAVSLNQIEHDTLRPLLGWRVHSTLVCAARSCPPLQREAFTAAKLDRQIDDAYRAWLARQDLNRFDPAKRTVHASKVFKWFKKDFAKIGRVKPVLARYAPEPHRGFAKSGDYRIEHLPYRWGLNDHAGPISRVRIRAAVAPLGGCEALLALFPNGPRPRARRLLARCAGRARPHPRRQLRDQKDRRRKAAGMMSGERLSVRESGRIHPVRR